MRKIKLCHIITRLILGGAQENTLYTIEGLDKNKYDVTLIGGSGTGPRTGIEDKARKAGAEVIVIPEMQRSINPFKDVISFFKLYKLIKKNKYDIVHTHSTQAGIYGRFAAKFAGAPIIIHTIHGLAFHPAFNPLIRVFAWLGEFITARFTDRIICVSDSMREKSLAAGIGRKSKYITIRSGFELDRFLNARKDALLVKKLGIKKNELVVGKIAGLTKDKGCEDFIYAAAEISKRFPQAKFLLIGDGELRQSFEERVSARGISDKFVFVGVVPPEKIPEYIALMDIVVHASYREGLARVLPQALAVGKPVVTYDVEGAREIVCDGKNGFLVPLKKIDLLVEKISLLLKDISLRRELSNNSRQLVDPYFRKEHIVKEIEKVYEQTLKTKHQGV